MSVVSSTRVELRKLRLTTTVEGQTALALAAILDDRKGVVNASSTADRLVRIMEGLRARVPAQKSELDKIRERRARRAAG